MKKQFGIWMDGQQATIIGRTEKDTFAILHQVKDPGAHDHSHADEANSRTEANTQQYFKAIAATMPNVDEVHVTGTGQVQEQFIHFLARTAQYKNVVATHSTSLRMADAHLLQFMQRHFK